MSDRSSHLPTYALVLLALAGGAGLFYWKSQPAPLPPEAKNCAIAKQNLSQSELDDRMSRGDRVLFQQEENFNRDRGIEKFKAGDYVAAVEFFKKAVLGTINHPESQIYLNNAIARRQAALSSSQSEQGKPYVLAAMVPIDQQGDVAKEILRGIADAQTKFNQDQATDSNNRLLEILIINDGNKPDDALQLACKIGQDQDVLAVVGHYSSDTSAAALPAYEQVQLAMVSPTATSTTLSSPVFFRTVPSDQKSGEALAAYAQRQNFAQVVVFFDKESTYSKSLTDAFTQAYETQGKLVMPPIDLTAGQESDALTTAREKGAQAIVLLPGSETRSTAISIAKLNAEQAPDQRLPLMGGDTLYHPTTLQNGGNSVANLVVVAPTLRERAPYTEKAEKSWGGRVGWRTPSSYDATEALIAVVRKQGEEVSREQVLAGLKQYFADEGDRHGEPMLFQAVQGAPAPMGAEFGFSPLPPLP